MSTDGDRFLEELCTRRLDHAAFPRVYLDATYVKARRERDVSYQAIVAATGVRSDGGLEILGIDVGDSEDRGFWRRFLFSLRVRGLRGVRVLGSEDHGGLPEALADVFPRASWNESPPGATGTPALEGLAGSRAILTRVVAHRAGPRAGADLMRLLDAGERTGHMVP